MSKKKSAKKTRATSASRRTAATRSRRSGAKRKARPGQGKIQLKPIRVLIARAIAGLQRLPPNESYKLTIERLQRCEAEFAAICDPQNFDDGCGPIMEFPREAFATSR